MGTHYHPLHTTVSHGGQGTGAIEHWVAVAALVLLVGFWARRDRLPVRRPTVDRRDLWRRGVGGGVPVGAVRGLTTAPTAGVGTPADDVVAPSYDPGSVDYPDPDTADSGRSTTASTARRDVGYEGYSLAQGKLKPGSASSIRKIYDTIKTEGVDAMKEQYGAGSSAARKRGGGGHAGHGHGSHGHGSHGHGSGSASGNASSHSVGNVKLDEPTGGDVCPAGAPVRHFTVHAIQVDIVYNKYGMHDPNGVMYVLERNKEKVLRQVRNAPEATIENPNPNATTPLVQPLTIRANRGDCVKVTFENDLSVPASMHMNGLPYNVSQSDGMAVGYNEPSFAGPEGSANDVVHYTYYANDLGTHLFADGTHLAESSDPEVVTNNVSDPDLAGSLRSNGLFGALVVEPKGATWTDPQTGEPLKSGVQADIHLPDRPDRREFVIYYHDGQDTVKANGEPLTWPHSDEPQSMYVMNYRGDPMGARLREKNESRCPACDKPEAFYSSWVHGDPGGGDLVFEAYVGDPVSFRLVGAQVEENHVHHLHGHRWKSTPKDLKSNTIDSQTINPGATYEATILAGVGRTAVRGNRSFSEAVAQGGAGYVQGSPGDYIFHCHLFPHYASGMWSVMRVFDKDTRGDDNRTDLQPLPDRDYQPSDSTVPPASEDVDRKGDEGNGDDEPAGAAPPVERGEGAGAGGEDARRGPSEEARENAAIPNNRVGEGDGDDETRFQSGVGSLWVPETASGRAQKVLRRLDRDAPPEPTPDDPGFPKFIPGERGERSPRPPGLPGGRDATELEESAIDGSGKSDPIKPGAPYVDPCPKDAKTREYNLTVFEVPVEYNDESYDDDGRIYALSKNVDEIRSGEMRPRPLFIRANLGDCVVINLRNELPPGEEPNEVSMHVHFVGFDILGSDGLALGYNYRSGAEPVGDKEASTGNITYRWYADEQGTIFWHDHLQGIEKGMHGLFGTLAVEPPNSTWLDPYTNQTIRAGPRARIVNPNGPDFREQYLAYQDYARLHSNVKTLEGSRKTVQINPPHSETLNDQGVSAINYANAPLYWRNNRKSPSDPAYAFSSYYHGDPQTPIIEAYRGDPVRIRLVQGNFEESHNFMLQGHRWRKEPWDPDSPTGSTQLIGVSEQFEFHVRAGGPPDETGGRYVRGLDPATVPPVREGFPARDYLYGSGITMDLWDGMWGIFRVWERPVEHLKPLPDRGYPDRPVADSVDEDGDGTLDMEEMPAMVRTRNLSEVADVAPDTSTTRSPVVVEGTGTPPPDPSGPGAPCRSASSTIEYNVSVIRTDITYNSYGDHDPAGIVYALSKNVDEIRSGEMRPKPLVLRAHEGQCVEVNLTNELPVADGEPYPHLPNDMPLDTTDAHRHPRMNVVVEWPPSARTSIRPTDVGVDVLGSGGTTVGMNPDQTVAPGETRTYRWFADEQGTSVFWDGADVRGHRHHGAYGMLIVEPPNSTWLDPETGEEIRTGTRAIIERPDAPDFRENALVLADGTYQRNPAHTRPTPTAIPDPEGQGFVSINYRSEPFAYRLGTAKPYTPDAVPKTDDRESMVFSSRVHGDPSTPVFEAYCGDPVVFRVGQPADRRKGVALGVSGHQFYYFWRDNESPVKGVRGGITPGKGVDIRPLHGAGGYQESAGDYLLRAMKTHRVEAGMWSIFRVHEEGSDAGIRRLPDGGGECR